MIVAKAGSVAGYGHKPRPATNKLFVRQQGQVMPFTVLFLAALILAIWILYDSGQINIQKMQLQNTADDAAYSSSVLMARNFNYIAYTNRAMVANQVAIGQMVGLASWIDFEQRAAANRGLSAAAGIDAETLQATRNLDQALENVVLSKARTNAAAANGAIGFMIAVNDAVVGGLSKAQLFFHTTALISALQISSDVSLANDPDVQQFTVFDFGTDPNASAGLEALIGLKQEQRPVAGVPSRERRRFNEFRNVVLTSRDHFTAERSYVWPIPFSRFNHWVHKFGGSELMEGVDRSGRNKWEWTAMDDASAWDYSCGGGRCSWNEVEAVGGGAAHALDVGAGNTYNYAAHSAQLRLWGAGAWRNPTAARQAVADDGSNKVGTLHNGGLRPFYDLRSELPLDDGPSIVIMVTKGEKYLQTQAAWEQTKPGFQVSPLTNDQADGGLPNNQIAALAKAQIYFYRPYEDQDSPNPNWNRTSLPTWEGLRGLIQDQKYEHGNLYNPFWQTHLVDTNDAERSVALKFDTPPAS